MITVSIDNATEGMIVGKNLLSQNGQCLVSEGTVLTPATIQALKRYNINSIEVADSSLEKGFLDEDIEEAEIICFYKVSEKFQKKPEDPMMKTLFRAALRAEAIGYLKCNQRELRK